MPPIFTIEKREEILQCLLEVGVELIKEIGIRKMSIDKITKRAGIGKGTFYHFFLSKEQYVLEVINFSKEKIFSYINTIIEDRGGIDRQALLDIFKKFSMYKVNDESSDNIIAYMKRDDELWLQEKFTDQIETNEQKEMSVIHIIFSHMIGLKQDIDVHVVANMMKIMAITVINRQELYEEVLDENIQIMIDTMCDYIFL